MQVQLSCFHGDGAPGLNPHGPLLQQQLLTSGPSHNPAWVWRSALLTSRQRPGQASSAPTSSTPVTMTSSPKPLFALSVTVATRNMQYITEMMSSYRKPGADEEGAWNVLAFFFFSRCKIQLVWVEQLGFSDHPWWFPPPVLIWRQ